MAFLRSKYRKTGDRCNQCGNETRSGNYRNFRDFVERLSGKELNKRTIENFIKAGALDGLCDNRNS